MALHRLRKILRRNGVLALGDGKLQVDAKQVWVDAWVFERLCNQVAQHEARPEGDHQRLAQRLLRLYAGHFLGDEGAIWAIAARERLRSKFLRSVRTLGDLLEGDGAREKALALYTRAVELDPLAEEFYARLMKTYRAQGRIAEALSAYRHCRNLLSITLGVEPSVATQALYSALKQSE